MSVFSRPTSDPKLAPYRQSQHHYHPNVPDNPPEVAVDGSETMGVVGEVTLVALLGNYHGLSFLLCGLGKSTKRESYFCRPDFPDFLPVHPRLRRCRESEPNGPVTANIDDRDNDPVADNDPLTDFSS
jgi:hypothetical protein